MFKKLFVLACVVNFCLIATSAYSMGNKMASESGDYCKDEMNQYFFEKFGTKAKIYGTEKGSKTKTEFDLKVWTNLCDDFFVLQYAANSSECKATHYGGKPQYLWKVWAWGDCKRILQGEEIPRLGSGNQ